MDFTKEIQDIAKQLFQENKIEMFVGYQKLVEENRTVPFIAASAEEAGKLVFTDESAYNLTNYLTMEHAKGKKVGIVVKGCDSRALNMLITEGQLKRENLQIVGVCCTGVKNDKGELYGNCVNCIMPDAVIHDSLLGTPKGKPEYQADPEVLQLKAKSQEERAQFFEDVFDNCIRCNACRLSCPLCYCEKCAIDQESAAFYNAANTVPNAATALLTWSLHLAGRCVDCRNCEKACPKNLPLHLLHKYNEMVIYENFQNYISGMNEKERGAFYQYKLEDPNDFIL